MEHPGIILKRDFIDAKSLTISKVAKAICVSRANLYNIVGGKSEISSEMALKLGRLFNKPPSFWQALQSDYNIHHAAIRMKDELEQIEPLSRGN